MTKRKTESDRTTVIEEIDGVFLNLEFIQERFNGSG